jgi:hypothetical protein
MTRVLAALSCAVFVSLGMTAGPASAASPGDGAFHSMFSPLSGMCAAVGDNSDAAGAGLIQYECNGMDNKQFRGTSAGGNLYTFMVRSTGMCIMPQSLFDHAEIVQQPSWNCGPLAVWAAESLGDDTYRLRNQATGLCMGVAWGKTWSGQPLDQTTCGAFPGQRWHFTAATGGGEVPGARQRRGDVG